MGKTSESCADQYKLARQCPPGCAVTTMELAHHATHIRARHDIPFCPVKPEWMLDDQENRRILPKQPNDCPEQQPDKLCAGQALNQRRFLTEPHHAIHDSIEHARMQRQ